MPSRPIRLVARLLFLASHVALPARARRTCAPPLAQERFLYYQKDGPGWCAGSQHRERSDACMYAEARYLNRTLIYDPRMCNDAAHQLRPPAPAPEYLDPLWTRVHANYEDALENHIDVGVVEAVVPAVSKDEWIARCDRRALEEAAAARAWATSEVVTPAASPDELRRNTALLLVRGHFFKPNRRNQRGARPQKQSSAPQPGTWTPLYWFELCESRRRFRSVLRDRAANMRQEAIRPPAYQREAAAAVLRRLGSNFTVVHVRRGDLTAACELDSFTRPARIAAVLKAKGVAPRSAVYVMSDEPRDDFFRKPALTNTYRVYRPGDFRAELRNALDTNYALFGVERIIWQAAATRLSTRGDLVPAGHKCHSEEDQGDVVGWS